MQFLVIEGQDGSGKTTLSHALVARLLSDGRKAIFTTEPADRKALRELLTLNPSDEVLTEWFVRDRQRHSDELRNSVSDDTIVVCDRYALSTLVYQGAKLGFHAVDRAHYGDLLVPDLLVFLDTDPKEIEKRQVDKSTEPNRATPWQRQHDYRNAMRVALETSCLDHYELFAGKSSIVLEVYGVPVADLVSAIIGQVLHLGTSQVRLRTHISMQCREVAQL